MLIMHQVKMKNTCRLIRPKHVSDKANNSYLPYAVPVYYHCHWLCFLAFTYRFVQANKTFKKVVYFDAKKGLGSAQVQPSYIIRCRFAPEVHQTKTFQWETAAMLHFTALIPSFLIQRLEQTAKLLDVCISEAGLPVAKGRLWSNPWVNIYSGLSHFELSTWVFLLFLSKI